MRQLIVCCLLMVAVAATAQDPASLLEEGRKLELKLKDEEAYAKYREVVKIQPGNQKALLKSAELSCTLGARKEKPEEKNGYYQVAKKYTETALAIDTSSAEAYTVMALVNSKIAEIEKSNDELVKAVKAAKQYADKAVAVNPQYGKGWYMLGKWHLDALLINALKKAAYKVIYGGVGEASIDKAIEYMEKCKTLEPYYCSNFYDLARAYEYSHQYEKSIAILQQLAKLPTKRQEDVNTKALGAALLQKLQ
ncbi:MAG TPA: hypothetical protein VLC98_06405 [Phnomibacter sp.]|nr:hypothetical protein [Phnomibacter sp.]